jgi:Dimerisation domain
MTNENSPEKILKLAQAFMESRILLSAAELNLFTILEKAPRSAQEIAVQVKGEVQALSALLNAVAALGLLTKKAETYYCEPSVSQFLAEDSPATILPMVRHMATKSLHRRHALNWGAHGKTDRSRRRSQRLQGFSGCRGRIRNLYDCISSCGSRNEGYIV